MLARERVIATIKREPRDRIPIYGWVGANLSNEITEAFGSVRAFEDYYEFDFAHLFGGPGSYDQEKLGEFRNEHAGMITPRDLLDLPMSDPNNMDAYANISEQIRHHKEERGRFVYVQTPGIFEANNGAFGIENHLMYLALYEEDLRQVYTRQAEWNRQFAMNCIDLGVDMVHVSDDWGGQNSLLFSPEMWWRLIHPYHKIVAEAVKARDCFLSLHSDGNVLSVVDGIIDLGYDVVHPWQESAGMGLDIYKQNYADAFVLMGGLDVQTTIGFGKLDHLQREIERVMRLFADGGMLFCTSHFVQAHCGIPELRLAFDTVRRLANELS